MQYSREQPKRRYVPQYEGPAAWFIPQRVSHFGRLVSQVCASFPFHGWGTLNQCDCHMVPDRPVLRRKYFNKCTREAHAAW